MNPDLPVRTYFFTSESAKTPGKMYQTILHRSGGLTCDCPGWCKRCVNGVRTCKHVRLIEGGFGLSNAAQVLEHDPSGCTQLKLEVSSTAKGVVIDATVTTRAFKFDEE
jgi:hypothetical protein